MKKATTTKKYKGETILDHEGGNRFYHKHLSPKAKRHKKQARRAARASRKRSKGRK